MRDVTSGRLTAKFYVCVCQVMPCMDKLARLWKSSHITTAHNSSAKLRSGSDGRGSLCVSYTHAKPLILLGPLIVAYGNKLLNYESRHTLVRAERHSFKEKPKVRQRAENDKKKKKTEGRRLTVTRAESHVS